MSRAILITGATGKQGAAVIDALLARNQSDLVLLAVTRNSESPSAKRLATKSPAIKIVQGDLNSVPSLFFKAKSVAGSVPLWGVYSVQTSMGKGVTLEGEVRQGKALVDEAIKSGVGHFVYSSVERGGDVHSWGNPTNVPHFKTKHEIEHYLRDSTAKDQRSMKWTILRPVMFMENIGPGFAAKTFLTMLRDAVQEKPIQWIATKDIGVAAAEAFHNPNTWANRAMGLASDELTFPETSKVFERVTGHPIETAMKIFGKMLKYALPDLGAMVSWLGEEGYKANIEENRKLNPGALTMEDWLRSSAFTKKHKNM